MENENSTQSRRKLAGQLSVEASETLLFQIDMVLSGMESVSQLDFGTWSPVTAQ